MAAPFRSQLVVTIDTSEPLGPQVRAARCWGIPWKVLEQMTDMSRQYLQRLMDEEGAPASAPPARTAVQLSVGCHFCKLPLAETSASFLRHRR